MQSMIQCSELPKEAALADSRRTCKSAAQRRPYATKSRPIDQLLALAIKRL